jgi:K(+)-stimulated pyrophosphate-energized sodium pump
MAADLFETYVVTVGRHHGADRDLLPDDQPAAQPDGLPLLIGGVCIVTSIIGTYFVKLGKNNIMGAMYKGFLVTGVLSARPSGGRSAHALGGMETAMAMVAGGNAFTGRTLFYCGCSVWSSPA